MYIKKIISIVITAALMATFVFGALVGCSGQGQSGLSSKTVRIGTMPTEDILPLWVAEDSTTSSQNLFQAAGIDAEIVVFDSAPALSAAIIAGEVDMAMVDIMRAVKLCESGAPVVLEWVSLGTDASQGRFGVMAAADAPYSTLKDLADQAAENPDSMAAKGVGVAANTVPEYVFDKLCEEAGLSDDAIPTQEVASLPERFSLMVSGNLAAAALPGSLLALGEAQGLKLLADDTSASTNISQSIIIATQSFAEKNQETVEAVAKVWDKAAQAINNDPQSYITLLAENANLNAVIAEIYPVSVYPMALLSNGKLAHPAASYVNPQIEWMHAKGYSAKNVEYDETTGQLKING